MKHIEEIELSIKVDIRHDPTQDGSPRGAYDWIVQGGTEESAYYFVTAEEAKADAISRLGGAYS